jgi:hypothetical protein
MFCLFVLFILRLCALFKIEIKSQNSVVIEHTQTTLSP